MKNRLAYLCILAAINTTTLSAQTDTSYSYQDCIGAISLYTILDSLISPDSITGPGKNLEEVNSIGANNGYSESCLPSQSTSGGASSETNSSWLIFEAKEDGFFNFNLVPNQPADIDFVVYDLIKF